MAHLRCDFFSEALSLSTSMTVLLPQRTTTQIGMAGAHDGRRRRRCCTCCTASATTTRSGCAGRRSSATSPRSGWPWSCRRCTAASTPTRPTAAATGPSSPRSCRSWSARCSGSRTGGRTPSSPACRWAATARSSGRCASRSGSPRRRACRARVDVAGLRTGRERPEDPRMFERIFGDGDPGGGRGRPALAARPGGRRRTCPALYVCCGTEDVLHRRTTAPSGTTGRSAGAKVTADFGPGAHDWAYWDARIQDVLAWLPLEHAGATRPAERGSAGRGWTRSAQKRSTCAASSSGVPLLSRTTSATARRCSSVACAAIRARASSSLSPRWTSRAHADLRIGLDDEHEVVGAGLTGLDEQRDVVDDDGVGRRWPRPARRPAPARAGARSRRAAPRASGVGEDDRGERRPVQRAVRPSTCSPERLDDGGQARRAGLDHLAGDPVGVDHDGAPRRPAGADTVLLPDPIPPVSPMRSTHGQ